MRNSIKLGVKSKLLKFSSGVDGLTTGSLNISYFSPHADIALLNITQPAATYKDLDLPVNDVRTIRSISTLRDMMKTPRAKDPQMKTKEALEQKQALLPTRLERSACPITGGCSRERL